MPLAVKLPLLMSAILALVLTVAVLAMYSTLRTTAIERVRDRVRRTTRQLATIGATNIVTTRARYLAAANDSLVRRALRGDRVAVAPALARLQLPTDSGMPVELWSADGRRVAFVGDDIRAVLQASPGRPELPESITRVFEAPTRSDSLRYGPLYGENHRVHFWLVQPVIDRGRPIGYIAHQRRIFQNAATGQTLRELAGDSVSLYYRNVDGSFWASADGFPLSAHRSSDTARGTVITSTGTVAIVNEEPLRGTPLVIGMTVPEHTVVARARRPLRTIVGLSAGLFLIGGLLAWVIGRRVVRPIDELARAAELLASGDFDARVPETGDPEIRHLAQRFNHMAAEIGDSRRALERQTAEARSANNAKSEFLTTMSHELRTPLNAIGGYVELLEMELRGPLTPEQRRDLDRIRSSQQHLLGLISAVLDLARVESGQLLYDLQHIALHEFLAGLDALIAPQAAAKNVALEYHPCDPDLAVVADREKLRQILLNLLSNAIRFTPAGGRVTLTAEALGGRVQIAVQDTGPGIPTDKRDVIFEPFVQLDRTLSQPREGIGLGLAISRDLARGMSGNLYADPHATAGSRFLLVLDRGSADAEGARMMSGEMPVVR
jgi:signal transduction histidine kinase